MDEATPKEFLLLSDNRLLCNFSDTTSLVLQSNRNCLTYYTQGGQKSRMTVDDVPEYEGLNQKIKILLKVFFPKNAISDLFRCTMRYV